MITSQQLIRYYEQFGAMEVTFTKQVTQAFRLLAKFVFLKCGADTLPCLIYSTSMREAKVIANLRASSFRALQQAGNLVALRYCFERSEHSEPLSFFVAAKLTGYTAYNKEAPDLYLLSLEYTHRPPDDLIELLGSLLEANVNSRQRKEARIDINPASLKSLGLEAKEAVLSLSGSEQRCLLRDLSFSGAKVLVYGKAEALVEKKVILYLDFSEQKQPLALPGKVLRFESVANREDIGAIAILFDEDKIPMPYKMAINNYLRQHRFSAPAAPREEA